jgi:hypothetical protein
MGSREFVKFCEPSAKQRFHSVKISARVMVKGRGHLDQSLEESFLRQLGVKPDLFPRLVRLKKLLPIEERDPMRENGLFFRANIFRARRMSARVFSVFRRCVSDRFGFRAQVPA